MGGVVRRRRKMFIVWVLDRFQLERPKLMFDEHKYGGGFLGFWGRGVEEDVLLGSF